MLEAGVELEIFQPEKVPTAYHHDKELEQYCRDVMSVAYWQRDAFMDDPESSKHQKWFLYLPVAEKLALEKVAENPGVVAKYANKGLKFHASHGCWLWGPSCPSASVAHAAEWASPG